MKTFIKYSQPIKTEYYGPMRKMTSIGLYWV